MALVARLPRQNLYLQEGHYGSRLHLRINPATQCCDGTYEPMVSDDKENAGDVPGEIEMQHSPSTGPGHAVLFGHMEPCSPNSKRFKLKGEWRHLHGPMKSGSFEMKVDDEGMANGWWLGEGDNASTPWQWMPSESDVHHGDEVKQTSEGDEHVIQTSGTPRLRASLSSRTDRGKTFFDEMLESEGAACIMIARWGVICAWIFLWQTLCALITSPLQVTGMSMSMVQCAFQAVYTITYMSFLVIYARMRVMPPLDYVTGVALYTVGYACFLALYVLSLVMEDDDAAQISLVLYLAGSLLFLTGSAVLVKATLPPPVPMIFRKLSFMEEMKARFSMMDQQSSLFWGSIMFLLGSVFFCLDATWSLLRAESKPALLGMVSISVGYGFFTIGRMYFLWGSTTADCDAFLRGSGWSYQWCKTLLRPLKACGRGLAKRRASLVAPSVMQEPVKLESMFNVVSGNKANTQATLEHQLDP